MRRRVLTEFACVAWVSRVTFNLFAEVGDAEEGHGHAAGAFVYENHKDLLLLYGVVQGCPRKGNKRKLLVVYSASCILNLRAIFRSPWDRT